jgi:hypothetical protein
MRREAALRLAEGSEIPARAGLTHTGVRSAVEERRGATPTPACGAGAGGGERAAAGEGKAQFTISSGIMVVRRTAGEEGSPHCLREFVVHTASGVSCNQGCGPIRSSAAHGCVDAVEHQRRGQPERA